MSIMKHHRLTCNNCPSQVFVKRFSLSTMQGSGTHEEFSGYVCRQCNADVDMSKMIERLELEHKRTELKNLEAEIAARDVPASSARVQEKSTVALKGGAS